MRFDIIIHAVCLSIFLLASLGYIGATNCVWETTTQSKKYSFNLVDSTSRHPHGARSEDGFYKIQHPTEDGSSLTTFWFQLCEHMKFNHDPPVCSSCESCGGPLHCGETCRALKATTVTGYSVCTTLGSDTQASYALIDEGNPELGLVVTMHAVSISENCSFTVYVYCSTKNEEMPSDVKEVGSGECSYKTSLKLAAGCPIVTAVNGGGMGWFGKLLTIFLCGFIVYLAIGIAYRVTVLGVSGLEAVPNLDFWRSLPRHIMHGLEFLSTQTMGLYRRVTQPSYIGLNE